MTVRPPRFDRPSFDVDHHIMRPGGVKTYYELLVQDKRMKNDPDPEGNARLEVGRVLDDVFGVLGKHYSGRKKEAFDRLLKRQKEALDIYERAIAGFEVDAPRLEKIYEDMDGDFRELGRKAEDLAAEVVTRPQKQSHRVPDPEGRRKAEEAKKAVEQETKETSASIRELGEESSTIAEEIGTLKTEAKPGTPEIKAELDDLVRKARKKLVEEDRLRRQPQQPKTKEEYDVEARLEAIAELEARPGHNQAAAEYLAWQRDVYKARAEQLGIKGGGGALGAKSSRLHEVELPAAEKAFRAASRAIKELLRVKGRNFTKKSEVTHDEIMGAKAWEDLLPTLDKKKKEHELNTDHLVSVDEIGNMPELGEFLRLYEEAPDALKGEMTRALIDLGDRPDNLVRMRADANQSAMKSNKSWEDITAGEAKDFHYEWVHVVEMRRREAKSRAAIIDKIREITEDFRKRIRGG